MDNEKHNAQISPWIIVGAVIILLIIVMVMAIRNINRDRRHMSDILSEKGAALIKAVEAGARTGMREMMSGGNPIQTLVEETARLPDVLYLAVTDKTGKVLVHSDENMIGKLLPDALPDQIPKPGMEVKWRISVK